MLFMLHLVNKLELPERGGGRAAIVLSGSPLFNGGAGQGESEIRRYLLENDLVEAIVALPTEIFFRTGIATYIWILSNRKSPARQGKVQLINATKCFTPMRRGEGNKRREISQDQIREIVDLYSSYENTDQGLVLASEDFGYRRVKVLRPLRIKILVSDEGFEKLQNEKAWSRLDESQREAWTTVLAMQTGRRHELEWIESFAKSATKRDPSLGKASKPLLKAFTSAFGVRDPDAEPAIDDAGNVIPDDALTDFENVPLGISIASYIEAEVLPHAPDAFIDANYRDEQDGEIGLIGYEINFNRFFYQYRAPRSLDLIDHDLRTVESEIESALVEMTK